MYVYLVAWSVGRGLSLNASNLLRLSDDLLDGSCAFSGIGIRTYSRLE